MALTEKPETLTSPGATAENFVIGEPCWARTGDYGWRRALIAGVT